jgi:hypothetical protein
MSKKQERIQKLISLDSIIRHQKRNKDGSARFNNDQLTVVGKLIEQILKLDNISKLNN